MFSKRQKRAIKEFYKRSNRASSDSLAVSLRVKNRTIVDDDGEGWTDYGYLDDDAYFTIMRDTGEYAVFSDEAIDNYFRDYVMVRIYSDYDCTGQAFTDWLNWHMNPDGSVSFQHHMSIDV